MHAQINEATELPPRPNGAAMSPTAAVRVQVVEEIPMLRRAVEDVLESHAQITVCGTCCSGGEALDAVQRLDPDVLLIDLQLHDMSGLAALERLQSRLTRTRVLVFASHPRPAQALAAMQAGARGYISKRAEPRAITEAVLTVHDGGSVVEPSIARDMLATRSPDATIILTPSETQVLRLLADGATDRDIARATFVSVRTVQNQLARLRRKTGTARRSDLTRWALENHWL